MSYLLFLRATCLIGRKKKGGEKKLELKKSACENARGG
jgi:hypothetical protein